MEVLGRSRDAGRVGQHQTILKSCLWFHRPRLPVIFPGHSKEVKSGLGCDTKSPPAPEGGLGACHVLPQSKEGLKRG